MTTLHRLFAQGQSVWIDFIRRSFLVSGGLQDWLDKGARGVTSNPTIFHKAISGSNDYDDDLKRLAATELEIEQIYRALALADIACAADIERPLWEESAAGDGFVSIEVSPLLANDTTGTVEEARSIINELQRPNVMIKVPATPAGIPAIEMLIADGINVNVTLIFGRGQYRDSAEAYIRGLQRRAENGQDISKVASVASVFVSRLDTLADPLLERLGLADLQGKLALANAKLTYADFKTIFSGPRWQQLAAKGARVQRPLWASTGTKNPAYPDTLYVDELVGPHTVNTIPPATLEAVLDHGRTEPTVELGIDEAKDAFTRVQAAGADLDAWTEQLLQEGVASFIASYDALLAGIQARVQALRAR